MKIKHTMKVALFSALTTMGGGILFTSCEDMFTTDNGLVTDDLTPKDTVYTMMGIVKNMQKIMDRTVIFGELRADLVDVNLNTPSDLRDIAEFNVADGNAYNDPRDFYSVINSCNIYLANVDVNRKATHSTEESTGEGYFEKEIIATKCYRAWTYLELAKIYGATNIPFITEPIVTADAAERMVADQSNRTDMYNLCTYFIDDLKSYANQQWDNEDLQPDYAVNFASGQESNVNVSYRKFFIPVRLLLAEFYLWRGSYTQDVNDYRDAVRYYHEYLTHSRNNRNNTVPSYRSSWSGGSGTDRYRITSSSYINSFRLGGTGGQSNIAVIPMDTTVYYGNTSSIREIFSSKYSNNYYPAAVPSQHLIDIYQAQDYFVFDSISPSDVTREYAPKTEAQLRTEWDKRWWMVVGDLRFSSIYTMMDFNNIENANFSSEWAFNFKWEGGTGGSTYNLTSDQRPEFITLFRLNTVYLHMAEALNRAGFPESAFVILKYGISTSALQTYASSEFEALKAITSITSVDGDFTQWNVNDFVTKDMVSYSEYRANNFNQWPIHGIGCGQTWYDDQYAIAVDLRDPKYAVGDETPVLDDNGDPVLNDDLSTKMNYGVWGSTDVSFGSLLWNGYILPTNYAFLGDEMSYDDFLGFIVADQLHLYLPATEDITTKTDAELLALYTDYQNDCAAIKATVRHNTALKANARADQQTSVADLVLTEEALEGMFEGTRFADLMRFSKQSGNDSFLGQVVSKRKGESTPDASIAAKLASENGWYIALPTR